MQFNIINSNTQTPKVPQICATTDREKYRNEKSPNQKMMERSTDKVPLSVSPFKKQLHNSYHIHKNNNNMRTSSVNNP